ncbi:MAG: Smr/MutS family protein [Holosporaceae bacterium]|jgi:DNA-nicking Smr family endonuclease|nr:Smr/MutS family protein [Holosporaceae bacterium]
MKDYIHNVKPLIIKNTITKCGIVKRKFTQKIESFNAPTSLDRRLCDLYRKLVLKNEPIPTISRKKSRRFVAEKILDLHGTTQEKALETLYVFFERCQRENIKNVLVITGGSSVRKSVIRSLFCRWIREYFSQYVSAYGQAGAASGGEGAFYVILKNQR